jgi:cytochrome c oxidase cbb3-type subunit I/II
VALVCCLIFLGLAVYKFQQSTSRWSSWYEALLYNYLPFTVLTFVAVVIGGLIQLVPTITVNNARNMEDRVQKLYTPLELTGRDIYVSEGCYNCHSQMIRTMLPDVLRYGPRPEQGYSRLGESIYDFPFQWGSKRTGPDLAREGGVRNNLWHYQHMMEPRSLSPGSNMPAYTHLATKPFDQKTLPNKIAVQRRLGVPYPPMDATAIKMKALEQGVTIAEDLQRGGVQVRPDSEMVAVIAYLQSLGGYETAPGKAAPPFGIPMPGTPGLPDTLRAKAQASN